MWFIDQLIIEGHRLVESGMMVDLVTKLLLGLWRTEHQPNMSYQFPTCCLFILHVRMFLLVNIQSTSLQYF
jgi:hypothetical protein